MVSPVEPFGNRQPVGFQPLGLGQRHRIAADFRQAISITAQGGAEINNGDPQMIPQKEAASDPSRKYE